MRRSCRGARTSCPSIRHACRHAHARPRGDAGRRVVARPGCLPGLSSGRADRRGVGAPAHRRRRVAGALGAAVRPLPGLRHQRPRLGRPPLLPLRGSAPGLILGLQRTPAAPSRCPVTRRMAAPTALTSPDADSRRPQRPRWSSRAGLPLGPHQAPEEGTKDHEHDRGPPEHPPEGPSATPQASPVQRVQVEAPTRGTGDVGQVQRCSTAGASTFGHRIASVAWGTGGACLQVRGPFPPSPQMMVRNRLHRDRIR